MFMITFPLFFSRPALADDACKGIRIHKDAFGAGSTLTELVQGVSKFTAIGVHMEVKGESATLTFRVKEGGSVGAVVASGAEFLFSMGDGTVLSLQTAGDSATQSYVDGVEVLTLTPYTFSLSDAEIALFASTSVEAVRLPVLSTGTTYDWTVPKRVKARLQEVAACAATL